MANRRKDQVPARSLRALLTERGIEAAQAPAGGRLTLVDTKTPGFIVRVTGRAKVYAVWFRVGGSKLRGLWTLGSVEEMSLADARAAAQQVKLDARRGIDPREARAEERRRRDEEKRGAITVRDAVSRFIESRALELAKRSADEYRRCLSKYIEPAPIAGRLVRDLRRGEAREFLDDVSRRNGPAMARSLHRILRSATAWALDNELLDLDPLSGLRVGRAEPRRRVLTDAELTAFWLALDAAPFLHAAVIRLQLLTAVRFPSELLTARWRDVDLGGRLWRIPGSVRKGRRPHDVPLSDFATRLLRAVHEKTGREDLVFAGIKKRSSVDYYAFDKAEATTRAETGGEQFQPHDLRRTVADGIVRLGLASWPVADAVLGHGPRGTARVYIHAAPVVEMAAALEKWGRHVETLVSGEVKGAEVVPLGRA